MRETLSKRQKSKGKSKVATTRARPKSASKKRKELKQKPVASGRATASVSKQSKNVSAKAAKSVKKSAAVRKAVKKTVKSPSRKVTTKTTLKAAKPKTKAIARKQVKAKALSRKIKAKAQSRRNAAPAKVKVRARAVSKSGSPVKNRRLTRTATITSRSKSKNKVRIPIVVSPAPAPPEPPRRQVSSGALRAFDQAVKVFNRRRFDDAKMMFENLLEKFPGDFEIVARAQMYIQVCKQKMENDHRPTTPRNADELYDRGVFALNIGDFTQARAFFEKALRLRPDEPHLLYSLAATHAQTGAHDQALDYLKRSIQMQPRLRSQAYNDSDFSGLRDNKHFLELIGLASPFDLLDLRR